MSERQNIEYKQSWERGTLKIINSCIEAGLPEPEMIEMDGGMQVTLFRPGKGLVDELVDGLVDGLVESQLKMLDMIRENPRVSKKAMSDAVGISTTAIDKNIKALKDKGFIKRVGSDRSGHWVIIKQKWSRDEGIGIRKNFGKASDNFGKMKFTEEKLEKAFTELLGQEGFLKDLRVG